MHSIMSLSKVGAAATDTTLNVQNMDDAICALFEVIHSIASEAAEQAENKQTKMKRAAVGVNDVA